MNKRIEWIDTARGIGAILVIMGHFMLLDKPNVIIYAFHMPLFFFLSGMTFRFKNDNFLAFFEKKIKALLIPHIIFSLIALIPYIYSHNGTIKSDLMYRTLGIILFISKNSIFYCGIWFTACMFVMYLMAYVVLRFNKITIIIISFILLILGWTMAKYNIFLPYCFETACVMFIFFCFGYVFKEVVDKINVWYILLYIPMTILAFINGRVDVFWNKYGNMIIFIICSFLGICATIAVSKLINRSMILQIIGKESLYVYLAQMPLYYSWRMVMNKINIYSHCSIKKLIVSLSSTAIAFFILWILKPFYYKLYKFILKEK